MSDFIIAPSILSANFACLGEEVNAVLDAGADMIHFDVMDNHYVPNLTIGPMVCRALRNYGVDAPIDVHLMVQPVDSMITQFIDAGASIITFHPEASLHVHRSIRLIKDAGLKAGLVLNPATPISVLEYVQKDIDVVLIMSVNPGFGGQTFIESSLYKIKQVQHWIKSHQLDITIQVDGGVNIDNILKIAQAGAKSFVAGSAIFNTQDYQQTISSMRQALCPLSL